MMSAIEIYQVLRQITLTKAKILEEVLANNQKSEVQQQQIIQNVARLKYEHNPTVHMPSSIIHQSQIEEQLLNELSHLRKEANDVQYLKNAKIREQLDLVSKGKQLYQILNQLENQAEENRFELGYMRTHTISFDEEYQGRLYQSFLTIQQQVQVKQQQNLMLEHEIDKMKRQLSQIYTAYKSLQHQTSAKKQMINKLKRNIEHSEFQYEKERALNIKLKKYQTIMKPELNLKNLEESARLLQQRLEMMKKMCNQSIESKQRYLDKMWQIKRMQQI